MVTSVCAHPHDSRLTYYIFDIHPLRYRALVDDCLLHWDFNMLRCLSKGVRRCCGWLPQTGPLWSLRDWCHVSVWGLKSHMLNIWWLCRWWGWCCHEDYNLHWHGWVLDICTYDSQFEFLCSMSWTWEIWNMLMIFLWYVHCEVDLEYDFVF